MLKRKSAHLSGRYFHKNYNQPSYTWPSGTINVNTSLSHRFHTNVSGICGNHRARPIWYHFCSETNFFKTYFLIEIEEQYLICIPRNNFYSLVLFFSKTEKKELFPRFCSVLFYYFLCFLILTCSEDIFT